MCVFLYPCHTNMAAAVDVVSTILQTRQTRAEDDVLPMD